MKPLALSLLFITLQFTVSAQTDSLAFDPGITTIDKKATQYITVKGTDLQKFPFINLEEAINIYFNGMLSPGSDYAYIIDGNISNAISALSIYDIESITLVLNAQSLVNGVSPSQNIVLVTTATGNKTGITAVANTFYTRRRNEQTGKLYNHDKPTFYHQYYLGGNWSGKQSRFGASLNYLHDAFSRISVIEGNTISPQRINLFRANASFNTKLGKRSALAMRLAVSPGDSAHSDILTHQYPDIRNKQIKGNNLLIFPSAKLLTNFNKHWSNELNIAYTHGDVNTKETDESILTSLNTTYTSYIDNSYNQNHLLLRNRIGFEKQSGQWKFNPTLAFSLLHGKTTYNFNKTILTEGNISTNGYSWGERKNIEIAITPNAAFSYKEVLFVQGGAQFTRFKKDFLPQTINKIHPFISASFDLIKAIESSSNYSARLFASYSEGNSWMEKTFYNTYGHFHRENNNLQISPYIEPQPATILSAGATVGWYDKLKLSYAFERSRYHELIIVPTILSLSTSRENESELNTHRFSLNYTDRKYTGFINVYHRSYSANVVRQGPSSPTNQGQILSEGFSAGWVNHFRFNNITAGINAMYYNADHKNIFLLQHLYAGYTTVINTRSIEYYLSARNLLQNKESDIPTAFIKYYGIGVKMNFQ